MCHIPEPIVSAKSSETLAGPRTRVFDRGLTWWSSG